MMIARHENVLKTELKDKLKIRCFYSLVLLLMQETQKKKEEEFWKVIGANPRLLYLVLWKHARAPALGGDSQVSNSTACAALCSFFIQR